MSQTIKRREAPELFCLLDRTEALINLGYATQHDLAEFLKVMPQRVYEWLSARIKHPRGETTIQIETWTSSLESTIRGRKLTAYRTEIKKVEGKHP